MFKFVLLCALVATASALNKFGVTKSAQNTYNAGHNAVRSSASSDDIHAEVNNFKSDVRADGFDYAYDTTNSIHAAASGDVNGYIKGDFGWVSPEGVPVAVQYVADESGYQPNSDLLPTPPPVPAAILKSLEYIRAHPPPVETARNFVENKPKNVNRKF